MCSDVPYCISMLQPFYEEEVLIQMKATHKMCHHHSTTRFGRNLDRNSQRRMTCRGTPLNHALPTQLSTNSPLPEGTNYQPYMSVYQHAPSVYAERHTTILNERVMNLHSKKMRHHRSTTRFDLNPVQYCSPRRTTRAEGCR